MSDPVSGTVEIAAEQDIVISRQLVRKVAQSLQFNLVEQTKIVTAASELSRNTLVYGGGGQMHWETIRDGTRTGLRLVFEDQGPGIADIDLAMTDGWTSGSGMGFGLSGSQRLVSDFQISSVVGEGTRVTVTRWK